MKLLPPSESTVWARLRAGTERSGQATRFLTIFSLDASDSTEAREFEAKDEVHHENPLRRC